LASGGRHEGPGMEGGFDNPKTDEAIVDQLIESIEEVA
jgi:hypothetical protein